MELEVDGGRVYAATGGRPFDPRKPTALFLHGAGMDHSCWPLQSRWFAWHGWSVLVPDLPAHGRSGGALLESVTDMAAWTGRVLTAADVHQAAIVGHSMGGAVALEAAASLGTRVTSVALLGTAARIPVHPDLLSAADSDAPRAYEMMTRWGHSPGAKLGGNQVPGIWMMGSARALFAQNRPGVLHADLAACDSWKTGAVAASKISCAACVVVGARDIMVPPKKGRELATMITGARIISLRRCGHMMMQEAPDACLDALIEVLGAASR
jgi:pimeloyl-ACP methyl ester carboxylesterase